MNRLKKSTGNSALAISCIGIALLLAGCSGSGSATTVDPGTDTPLNHSSYEVFDAEKYAEERPVADSVSHEIPEILLNSVEAATQAVQQNVQGFRIQVLSSVEKDVAIRQEEAIKAWWRSIPAGQRPAFFSDPIRVYLGYRQPYYRVRVGNFSTRQQAETALAYLQDSFPESFIAIDNVVVYE